MARVVAAQLAGDARRRASSIPTRRPSSRSPASTSSSLGDFADGEDRQEIVLRDATRRRLQAPRPARTTSIIGTVLFGETADGAWFNDLKKKGVDISDMRETLIFGQAYQGGAPLDPTAAVAALPDDAEICGCNGVCKGKIVGAIKAKGLTTLDAGARPHQGLGLLRLLHRPRRAGDGSSPSATPTIPAPFSRCAAAPTSAMTTCGG